MHSVHFNNYLPRASQISGSEMSTPDEGVCWSQWCCNKNNIVKGFTHVPLWKRCDKWEEAEEESIYFSIRMNLSDRIRLGLLWGPEVWDSGGAEDSSWRQLYYHKLSHRINLTSVCNSWSVQCAEENKVLAIRSKLLWRHMAGVCACSAFFF